MNEPFKEGTKLWDPYFKRVVVVEKTGIWTDTRYITGRFYRVRHPDGTIMDTHETAFEPLSWQRQRDSKGHFMKQLGETK